MTHESTSLRIWQKKAKRRLFFTEERSRFTWKDWLVMLGVTLVYAAVAFTNLGAHEIAQTYYTMETGDDICVAFEKPEEITTVKYYTSFGTGKFSLKFSPEDEGYSPVEWQIYVDDESGKKVPTMTTMHEHVATDMYEWQFVGPLGAAEINTGDEEFQDKTGFTAQYVTIHAVKGGLQMLEMAFCDSEGNPVKIASVSNMNPDAERGDDPARMFDEQQFVPLRTYYMTEMYFDEVYHARTAYEYITHHSIYEWTHPPLGKNILSIGIYLFGMNPFGWRFMGTLFGMLMLPLMYLFAKKLFKKTLFAFIPTFLLAVDFMHYTQTRIATIDSYSVFWIMLMYLFMYLYAERNYNREPLVNTLLPLSLAGMAFGLGAATKWLCIYAGVGLAILLFVQLFKRYREYAYANRALTDDTLKAVLSGERLAFLRDISRGYVRRTLITLLWCVVFFIIVPLGIYISAYAPYLAPASDTTGYLVRYAFFAFAGLLILALFAMSMLKLKGDRRAEAKEAGLTAADAARTGADTVQTAAPEMDAAAEPARMAADTVQTAIAAEAALTGADTARTAAPDADKPGSEANLNRRYAFKYALTISLCVLALVMAGLFIYYTSFVLYTDADQGAYNAQKILDNQENMFNYHSELSPDHVHPFSSMWYTWPIDYRPVFFFQGHGYTDGTMSSMSTMGNPAVWWGGIAAVAAMIVIRIRKGAFGRRTFFLSVAALSQFAPYIFITREMFIYHYFATVPFMILLMGVLCKYLIERTRYGRTFVYIFLGVCLVLFVMFYPVTTGTVVSKAYSDTFLRWSSMWPFY
jgi:hypothetical protein